MCYLYPIFLRHSSLNAPIDATGNFSFHKLKKCKWRKTAKACSIWHILGMHIQIKQKYNICTAVIIFLATLGFLVPMLEVNRKSQMKRHPKRQIASFQNNIVYGNIPYWTDENIFKDTRCISDDRMTSPAFSTINLIHVSKKTGVIKVKIQAFDGTNKSKTRGGDVFLLWAEEKDGDGRVAGTVTDNSNGTYTGVLKLYWLGITIIRAKLGTTLDNFCLRRKAMLKYGNSAFSMPLPVGIKASFISGDATEETLCGTEPKVYGYKSACNLTILNDGNSWYCGKPLKTGLYCSNISTFRQMHQLADRRELISKQDPDEWQHASGYGEVDKTVSVMSKKMDIPRHAVACHVAEKNSSWTYSTPSGYHFNNIYHMLHCRHTIKLNPSGYRNCLRNKTLVLMGDSTVRQYVDYLVQKVLLSPAIDLKNLEDRRGFYRPDVSFSNFGIRVIYKIHEMPMHARSKNAKGITSVATEIDSLAKSNISGENLVVFVCYGSHMLPYPLNRYRERIQRLASAIENLLAVKPKANIFIKGPHVYFYEKRFFDIRVSLITKDIIFQEFKNLMNRVIYLDLWSLTTAMNNSDLHPEPHIMDFQLQQFMSYVCST